MSAPTGHKSAGNQRNFISYSALYIIERIGRLSLKFAPMFFFVENGPKMTFDLHFKDLISGYHKISRKWTIRTEVMAHQRSYSSLRTLKLIKKNYSTDITHQ